VVRVREGGAEVEEVIIATVFPKKRCDRIVPKLGEKD